MLQVCEDAPVQLEGGGDLSRGTGRPSDVLVPRLLLLFKSPFEEAKCAAVKIMNLLAGSVPSAVADNLDTCAFLKLDMEVGRARPSPNPI